MHRDGYGFVIPDAASLDDSLEIAPRGRCFHSAARHRIFHAWRSRTRRGFECPPDGRAEGRIIRSMDRAHPTVVGIFHYGQRHNYVKPIDEKVTQEIVIPPGMEYPQFPRAPASQEVREACSEKQTEDAVAARVIQGPELATKPQATPIGRI